jgi:hypothetical protein
MRIYRLAKGWAIFVYIFMILIIAGSTPSQCNLQVLKQTVLVAFHPDL